MSATGLRITFAALIVLAIGAPFQIRGPPWRQAMNRNSRQPASRPRVEEGDRYQRIMDVRVALALPVCTHPL